MQQEHGIGAAGDGDADTAGGLEHVVSIDELRYAIEHSDTTIVGLGVGDWGLGARDSCLVTGIGSVLPSLDTAFEKTEPAWATEYGFEGLLTHTAFCCLQRSFFQVFSINRLRR